VPKEFSDSAALYLITLRNYVSVGDGTRAEMRQGGVGNGECRSAGGGGGAGMKEEEKGR
jgi:hypothetical protein